MALCYYILPAIAIALKVRKRQLNLSFLSATTPALIKSTDTVAFVSVAFNKFLVKDKTFQGFEITNKVFDKLMINSLVFKAFTKNLSIKLNSVILQG
jgi:hypothetical protein